MTRVESSHLAAHVHLAVDRLERLGEPAGLERGAQRRARRVVDVRHARRGVLDGPPGIGPRGRELSGCRRGRRTSVAARAGSRAAPRCAVPRVRTTRDARDVDGVAAMRDVRALMSSRGQLWRRAAKPAEGERKLYLPVDVDLIKLPICRIAGY